MNTTSSTLRVTRNTGGGTGPRAGVRLRDRPGAAAATGLWVFMGVATMLFSLFLAAYVIRLDGVDGYPLAMPWQLWLSTAVLAAGSILLQRASAAARESASERLHALLLAGGVSALVFIGTQLWAWQALLEARVLLAGNPAGSFFYLLTAMHGLHVIGGLVGWWVAVRAVWRQADPASLAWRITLCARYWHFLLVVWVVLFAAMALLTPELVRVICGPPRR